MFSFLGFKKKPVVEDIEPKAPKQEAPFNTALPNEGVVEALPAKDANLQALPIAPEHSVSPLPTGLPSSEEAISQPDVVQTLPVSERVPEPNERESARVLNVEPEPEPEPDALAQMATVNATREDVIAAYKIFLGRLPESMEVVQSRVGVAPSALLVDFLGSKEFLDQTPKAQLVLTVAKKIAEAHRQSTSAENTAPNAEVDAKSP